MPWTVNASFQPGIIVSFHDDLSIFPGIDETGLDGRITVNIADETLFEYERWGIDLGLTHLTIPLCKFAYG